MTLDAFLETLNDDLDVELAKVTTFARDLQKENAAMRDALRQVNILLRSISAHDGPGFPHGTCCNLAGQALAKLQPFIK